MRARKGIEEKEKEKEVEKEVDEVWCSFGYYLLALR